MYAKPDFTEIEYSMKLQGLLFKKTTVESVGYNEDTGEETKFQQEIGVFYDAKTGDEVFRLIDFSMLDSKEKPSNVLKWDYIQVGDEYVIRLYLDTSFLNDESTTYPVIVDPTVQGSSVTFDTFASQLYPSNNYYLSTFLRTGKDSTYGQRKTFIKWTLPTMADEYPIDTAHISLCKYTSSGAINLNADRIYTSWSSSTLTWTNSPNTTTDGGSYISSETGGWVDIYISPAVKRWRGNVYPNYGMKIYDDTQTNPAIWATFYSSDYSTVSNTPKLVITLNTSSEYHGDEGPHFVSNYISIRNELASYSTQFVGAVAAWNDSAAECSFVITTDPNCPNNVYVDDTIQDFSVVAANGNPYSHFHIILNSQQAAGTEYPDFTLAVFIHELGHTLGLVHVPNSPYTIMGSGGENIILHPTISDITKVNEIW